MRRCPCCREDSVSETTDLEFHSLETEGCLGLITRATFIVLKIIPMGVFICTFILTIIASSNIDRNLCYCLMAILLFSSVFFVRIYIPGLWLFIFRLLSWGTNLLDPNETAYYVYDRKCKSCGANWSRRSYETWSGIHLSAKCPKCRFEFATAPVMAGRCARCGSKNIDILVDSGPISGLKSQTIQELLESYDARRGSGKTTGLIKKLVMDGSPQAVEYLAEFVAESDGSHARDLALAALEDLTDQESIDAVCCVWAVTRNNDLATNLMKHEWIASEPLGLKVLTALKVGNFNRVNKRGIDVLEPLARSCEDEDPVISSRARQILPRLLDDDLEEALCRLIIERDYDFARDLAVGFEFAPKDEHQRALYFFMTEQWAKYDLLDFDRQLLRSCYRTEPSLQSRIREKLRASGRVDFLPALVGEDIRDHVSALDTSEIDLIFHTYISNQEWDSLWKLALEVPFIWSMRIIRELEKRKWQPVRTDVQNTFQELTALADQDLPLRESEIFQLFPSAQLKAQARVAGRINAVAFSPIRPVIAVGTSARKVVVWNYQDAKREHVIGGFSHSIGHVVYTGDGVVLSAERTNERFTPCSISGWDQEQQFQLGVHEGSVTALAQVGKTQAISAGRDGGLILWDIPSQEIVSQREAFYANQWVRAMGVSPDATKVALLHEGVEFVTLPNLSEMAYGSSKGKKARCAVFLPGGKTLAAGMFDGHVLLFELSSGGDQLLREGLSIERHKDRVEGIGVLNRQNVLVTASYDGEIRLTGLEDRNVIGSYTAPRGRVTSLHISPNEYFMVVGNSESMLSFWDLKGLNLQMLLIKPFAEASVTDLPILAEAMRDKDLTEPARATLGFIECILHHRFRYDIEVGEVPSIMMGEFDIEVE
jgi:WD40 repeat protein